MRHFLFSVVDSRDHRDANGDPAVADDQSLEVMENRIVGNARVKTMFLPVHEFQIEQYLVGQKRSAQEGFRLGETAGLNNGSDAPFLTGAQKGSHEDRLGKRLAAGKCHAASGIVKEDDILLHFRDKFRNGVTKAGDLAGFGHAETRAFAAVSAGIGRRNGPIYVADGMFGAGRNAFQAMAATLLEVHAFRRKLWLSGLWHHQQDSGQPLKKTVVRTPGPSCVAKRMTLKISPEISLPRCAPSGLHMAAAISIQFGLFACNKLSHAGKNGTMSRVEKGASSRRHPPLYPDAFFVLVRLPRREDLPGWPTVRSIRCEPGNAISVGERLQDRMGAGCTIPSNSLTESRAVGRRRRRPSKSRDDNAYVSIGDYTASDARIKCVLPSDKAVVRSENTEDHSTVRSVNEAAFRRSDEADLVERLWSEGVVLASLVAELKGRVVGHILFSRMSIDTDHAAIPAVALAPMAVLPEYQRRAIGGQLIRCGLDLLRRRGEHVVVVLGHPDYYPRFGFSAERAGSLESPFPRNGFMALELIPNALDGVRGKVRYPTAFGL